ncbi:MAG TPA: hypothetical protein VNO70_16150 [Blastocatellia bacterium]|nr:hypothetical protein [Blastocatellia bacterium]
MDKFDSGQVANPGSTLGEALGSLIEREVNRVLRPIAEENGCVYVTAGRPNPRTGLPTKLLLKDAAGNEFNIDSVIANERMQPLVLIESKYIRYKKHNRDKGSWICTAHYSLRRAFPTIRKSIAILAGSWSGSSKAMMESFDVTLFEVGFPKIIETLARYGVDFAWQEKERDRAMEAWQRWSQLTDNEYDEIARVLLADVEPALRDALKKTLDPAIPRQVHKVSVTVETNLGETRYYTFDSLDEAIEFLSTFDEEIVLDDEGGPSLWPAEE